MTKRVKITFAEVNKGKIIFIPREKIAETNQRLKEAMKKSRRKNYLD